MSSGKEHVYLRAALRHSPPWRAGLPPPPSEPPSLGALGAGARSAGVALESQAPEGGHSASPMEHSPHQDPTPLPAHPTTHTRPHTTHDHTLLLLPCAGPGLRSHFANPPLVPPSGDGGRCSR